MCLLIRSYAEILLMFEKYNRLSCLMRGFDFVVLSSPTLPKKLIKTLLKIVGRKFSLFASQVLLKYYLKTGEKEASQTHYLPHVFPKLSDPQDHLVLFHFEPNSHLWHFPQCQQTRYLISAATSSTPCASTTPPAMSSVLLAHPSICLSVPVEPLQNLQLLCATHPSAYPHFRILFSIKGNSLYAACERRLWYFNYTCPGV